jgi:TPR repeat protein
MPQTLGLFDRCIAGSTAIRRCVLPIGLLFGSANALAQGTWAEAARQGEEKQTRRYAVFSTWDEEAVTAYQDFAACLEKTPGQCAPRACKPIGKKLEWLGALCEAKAAESAGKAPAHDKAVERAWRLFTQQPGITPQWLEENNVAADDGLLLPKSARLKSFAQRLDHLVRYDYAQFKTFAPLNARLDENIEDLKKNLEARAQTGEAQAQYDFAQHLMMGGGLREDWPLAAQWYRKAAEQGHASAQYKLGEMFWNGRGVPQDAAQAVAWFRKAADQGNAAAQSDFGFMYRNGLGVAQDDAQALTWFRKAAEQGNAMGQNNLGSMYDDGRGVAQDAALAVVWYRKAAEQGLALAQNNLGAMYGNSRGVAQDDAQAVAWYRRAAEQGNDDAQYNLGVMYANGRGVAQDDAQAVAWYRKAAEQGDADAQYSLGVRYDNGRGVPQDDAQAAAWYRKAAEQGQADAQYNLGVMYANGRGVAQDDAQAVTWYRKAAEQGQADALNNLGVMYVNGAGVEKNYAWAVYWQALAAQKGNEVAVGNLVENREHLVQYRVPPNVNIRAKPSTDAAVVRKSWPGEIAYRTDDLKNGWYEVYLSQAHTLGYVSSSLLTPVSASTAPATSSSGDGWPARPAKKPGAVTCNTQCFNSDCKRTYDDGRKVRFQAKRVFEFGEWKWDSGGC